MPEGGDAARLTAMASRAGDEAVLRAERDRLATEMRGLNAEVDYLSHIVDLACAEHEARRAWLDSGELGSSEYRRTAPIAADARSRVYEAVAAEVARRAAL